MKNVVLFFIKKIFGSRLISFLFATFSSIFNFSKILVILDNFITKFSVWIIRLSLFLKQMIKKDISFLPFLLNTLVSLYNYMISKFRPKAKEEVTSKTKSSKVTAAKAASTSSNSNSKLKLLFIFAYRIFQLLLLLSVGSVIMEYHPDTATQVRGDIINNFNSLFYTLQDYLINLLVLFGSLQIYLKDLIFYLMFI